MWIALAAFLALLIGLWLSRAGRAMRLRRSLSSGKTVSVDDVTLISRTPRPWHHAQLGVYFVLIEEQLRVRPPHGFIVCSDGTRHRVENTSELRACVLDLAGQIRAARRYVSRSIPVEPKPG